MENYIEFLLEIYKGAKMGVESINTLMPKCESAELKNELKRQKKEYNTICEDVEASLGSEGVDVKEPPVMAQVCSWINIQMSTLFNKSKSNIAEKLMFGNLMGIVGITKILNKYKGEIDKEHIKYSERFIDACETNMKNLKGFLSE